jgi:hypothetical protein
MFYRIAYNVISFAAAAFFVYAVAFFAICVTN